MIAISPKHVAPRRYQLEGTTWEARVYQNELETYGRYPRPIDSRTLKTREKIEGDCERIEAGKAPRKRAAPRRASRQSFVGVDVPQEWIVARGFGSVHGNYYAGGRYKSNGSPKLHLRIGISWEDVRQAYLCEQAGGSLGTVRGWGELA